MLALSITLVSRHPLALPATNPFTKQPAPNAMTDAESEELTPPDVVRSSIGEQSVETVRRRIGDAQAPAVVAGDELVDDVATQQAKTRIGGRQARGVDSGHGVLVPIDHPGV
ncbi:MAG TPA: hypothetical protein VJT73_02630 [Polyangiaceae bacterium]|nr:hypothetical protein [Polyangiaceae bacterium]